MTCTGYFLSPLGELLLSADEQGLTGLWFVGQRYFARTLPEDHREEENAILARTREWLSLYFSRQNPPFTPPLHPTGTDFQRAVWRSLLAIPYGEVRSYGDIARELAAQRGVARISAQAVGGAVGRNPISLIIPCHRVVGHNGSLTGYAGGLDRKALLLQWEGCDPSLFFAPGNRGSL